MSSLLQLFLSNPIVTHIRRNHALEHATIHILSAYYPYRIIVGRSDVQGFFIYGDLPTNAISQAVDQALRRLRGGERRLAIHPNCGTNLLAAGMLSGGAAFFSLSGTGENRWQDRLERLPLAIMATIFALILSRPIGSAIQQYVTTLSDPGALEVASIKRYARGRSTFHRVTTHA